MMKQETKDTLIIAGAILAVGALAFMAGFIFGTKKKKQWVVSAKGELQEVEVD